MPYSAIIEHLYLFMYKCKIQIHNSNWGQAENHTGPDSPGKGLNSHVARRPAQHNESGPHSHHGNEQEPMAQVLCCRDVLRGYQCEGLSSSSLGKPPRLPQRISLELEREEKGSALLNTK